MVCKDLAFHSAFRNPRSPWTILKNISQRIFSSSAGAWPVFVPLWSWRDTERSSSLPRTRPLRAAASTLRAALPWHYRTRMRSRSTSKTPSAPATGSASEKRSGHSLKRGRHASASSFSGAPNLTVKAPGWPSPRKPRIRSGGSSMLREIRQGMRSCASSLTRSGRQTRCQRSTMPSRGT
jgi:hypothetical protein